MQSAGVAVGFQGPPPPFEALSEMSHGQSRLVDALPPKVRFRALGTARRRIDDPHFILDYPCATPAIPKPCIEEQLPTWLCARGSRSTWTVQAAVGLWSGLCVLRTAAGRCFEVHHCMVDGFAATD